MILGWSENILFNSQQAVLRPQTATTLPTPLLKLRGSPMLAWLAHVHTRLSSPKSCLSKGRKQRWRRQWQQQQVSAPHVCWQVLPCGRSCNCQASFISGDRAESWCQPYGDFVKAIDLVLDGSTGIANSLCFCLLRSAKELFIKVISLSRNV